MLTGCTNTSSVRLRSKDFAVSPASQPEAGAASCISMATKLCADQLLRFDQSLRVWQVQ